MRRLLDPFDRKTSVKNILKMFIGEIIAENKGAGQLEEFLADIVMEGAIAMIRRLLEEGFFALTNKKEKYFSGNYVSP